MSFSLRATIAIAGTTLLCSLLVAVIVMAMNIRVIEDELENEFSAYVQTIAAKMQAAVLFEDDEYLNELLSPLLEDATIENACVYKPDGQLLAGMYTELCDYQLYIKSTAHENMVLTPIMSDGKAVGILIVETNSTRINDFERTIFFTSAIALAIGVLLIVMPVSYLLLRRYSVPIQAVINKTREIVPLGGDIISRPEDVVRALHSIRERMSNMDNKNQEMAIKLSILLNNYERALSSLQSELKLNSEFHNTNMLIFGKSNKNTEIAEELFALSASEAKTLNDYIHELIKLLDTQEEYVRGLPKQISPADIFTSTFSEYYEQFANQNVSHRIVTSLKEDHIFLLEGAYKAFLQFSFILFDKMIMASEAIITLELNELHNEVANAPRVIDCTLKLACGAVDSPETKQQTREIIQFNEDAKTLLEKLKFYASYNASQPEAMSLKWDGDLGLCFTLQEFKR